MVTPLCARRENRNFAAILVSWMPFLSLNPESQNTQGKACIPTRKGHPHPPALSFLDPWLVNEGILLQRWHPTPLYSQQHRLNRLSMNHAHQQQQQQQCGGSATCSFHHTWLALPVHQTSVDYFHYDYPLGAVDQEIRQSTTMKHMCTKLNSIILLLM